MRRRRKFKLKPMPLEAVVENYPAWRQSLLASFDTCALQTLFDLESGHAALTREEQTWSTVEAAMGTLGHRFAAECLRTMKREGEGRMEVDVALDILFDVCLQRDVPAEHIVRVPQWARRDLRIACIKWATENKFTIQNLAGVEQMLSAPISYRLADGTLVERTITGTPDALIVSPPDGAIIPDWKFGRALPPEHPVDDGHGDVDPGGLSFGGYYQQRVFAYLVLKSFPAVKWVSLREFYVRYGQVRKAVIRRENLDTLERDLAMDVEQLDRAVAGGQDSAMWSPTPGKACQWCRQPGRCPIEREARGEGAITGPAIAKRYAAEYGVADRVRTHRRKALMVYTERTGESVPVKDSKGRRVLGWRTRTVGGKLQTRFEAFTPDASDRGPEDSDLKLADAFRESAARKRQEREAAKA